jgi:DNA-binding CsgD family transcriptional regulator
MTTTDLDGLLRYEFETYSMCDETMSPERRLFALNSLTNTLVRVGRLAELIDIAAAAVDLVRTTGLGGPLGAAMAEYWVGCLVSLGRWSEAEQVYDDVRDLIEQTRGDQPFYYFDLALIRQGRLEAARDHIEVLRRWLATPGYWDETLEELAAAVLEFDALDRPDDVDVVGLVDDARKKGSAGQRLGEWMLLAEAIGVLADRSRDPCGDSALVADWLRDAARDPKELVGEHALMKRRAIIEADRLAGRPRPEAWRDLAIDSADLGLRYDEAYAWFRAGEAGLCGVGGRGAGSKREARCALRHACVTAERLGAEPLLRRIHALARSARLDLTKEPAEPAPVSPLTELGLTGREADVMQLVAAGMSNGAIGARLFISRKTASVHVSNILRKLGVSNRIEAAGILHRISLDRDGAASADRFDP